MCIIKIHFTYFYSVGRKKQIYENTCVSDDCSTFNTPFSQRLLCQRVNQNCRINRKKVLGENVNRNCYNTIVYCRLLRKYSAYIHIYEYIMYIFFLYYINVYCFKTHNSIFHFGRCQLQ